jgi:hypothetical protein
MFSVQSCCECNMKDTQFTCCDNDDDDNVGQQGLRKRTDTDTQIHHVADRDYLGQSVMILANTSIQDINDRILYDILQDTDIIMFGRNPKTHQIVFVSEVPEWFRGYPTPVTHRSLSHGSEEESKEKVVEPDPKLIPLQKGDPVSAMHEPFSSKWMQDLCASTLKGIRLNQPIVVMIPGTGTHHWIQKVLRTATLKTKDKKHIAVGLLFITPLHEAFNVPFEQLARHEGPPSQNMKFKPSTL